MKKNISVRIIAVLTLLISGLLLMPFIYVSKYAYPWADDFSYSWAVHQVFIQTGSVAEAIVEAFKSMADTYMTWQGTYTSCFLMSLQPAVWGIKGYHMTGVIMLGTMLLAYSILFYAILRKWLNVPVSITVIVTMVTYIYSVECVRGIAEGFTWFNGAVHYTFNNAWSWLFVGLLVIHLQNCHKESEHRFGWKFLLCILAVLIAGGNNVTVLGGILFNLLLVLAIFVYQLFKRNSSISLALEALPMLGAYIVGGMVNFMAPGNSERMSVLGGEWKSHIDCTACFRSWHCLHRKEIFFGTINGTNLDCSSFMVCICK